MLDISCTYIIGVDIVEGEEPVISISKHMGMRLDYVHTVRGQEAIELYEKLSNKNLKGGK